MENNLTRKQKRHNERVGAEAKEVYTKLTAKFLEYFIYADSPTEQAIIDKMDELDRKWKVYCHQKHLKPEVYPIVNDYMTGVVKQYSEMNKKTEEGFGLVEPQTVQDGIPA
jgi:hypothetical protein